MQIRKMIEVFCDEYSFFHRTVVEKGLAAN